MYPIIFESLFYERIWGGKNLATKLNLKIPQDKTIGESWDIVDRDDAQSIVKNGTFKGLSLKELRLKHGKEILGDIDNDKPFPILVKILDACQDLSLQVHPPKEKISQLKDLNPNDNPQSKSEFWYILDHNNNAQLMVGLKNNITKPEFINNLSSSNLLNLINLIPAQKDRLIYVPSGVVHCIGAGNLILEVQENSDTTYRVSDWGRLDTAGKPRQLHIDESIQCIDFDHNLNANIQDIKIQQCYEVLENEIFKTLHYAVKANEVIKITTTNTAQVLSNCGDALNVSSNALEVKLQKGQSCLLPANCEFNIGSDNFAHFLVSIIKL